MAGFGTAPQAIRSVVVRNRAAGGRVGEAARESMETSAPEREVGAGVRGQLESSKCCDFAERERLGDRERPVPEVWLGCDKLDVYAIPGQRPQRERSLERRDTSTRDENVHPVGALRCHGASVARPRRRDISDAPEGRCGELPISGLQARSCRLTTCAVVGVCAGSCRRVVGAPVRAQPSSSDHSLRCVLPSWDACCLLRSRATAKISVPDHQFTGSKLRDSVSPTTFAISQTMNQTSVIRVLLFSSVGAGAPSANREGP